MKRNRSSFSKAPWKESASSNSLQESAAPEAEAGPAEPKKQKYTDETALTVTLSGHDKASQLVLSDDKMKCWGNDGFGYCLARATHAVDNGKYFWECEIMAPDDRAGGYPPHLSDTAVAIPSGEGHVRIGWATDAAPVSAPVGYDKFGFGYRDLCGSKVTNSVRYDNYGDSYEIGDVIGCHIVLDRADPRNNEIRFFKNGKDQGTAFKGAEVTPGVYFPAVSLYRDSCLRVNFGPFFIYPFNFFQNEPKYSAHYFMGTLPVSELQPMTSDFKKIHSEYISQRRAYYRPINTAK